jgi:hypothetical protein
MVGVTDDMASGPVDRFPMLFLLNDVVFDLDEACPVTPADTRRFEKLSFDYVLELGCELFAENPLLHRNDPERARRLAWLIAERSPDVNAALFAAPAVACDPDLVEPRFCALPDAVMRQLQAKGRRLDAVAADRAVWKPKPIIRPKAG